MEKIKKILIKVVVVVWAAVALFGTNLNAAGMNTLVGYIYDMLYGDSGGYPSFASAAAIILFAIVLTITVINLIVSKKTSYDGGLRWKT